MRHFLYIFLGIFLISCSDRQENTLMKRTSPYILVLGVAQDAGYPQIACKKACCQRVYENPKHKRLVSSIALVDPISNESWIFDATPDFSVQTKILSKHLNEKDLPDGIFLTHGHMGHYTGLMFLGREALAADKMPVYAMPRMQNYLTNNGPWSQLVTLKNIELRSLKNDTIVVLNERISIQPIEVPHRDEFTETVGFIIKNQDKKPYLSPILTNGVSGIEIL